MAGLLKGLLIEQTKSRPAKKQRQRIGGVQKRGSDPGNTWGTGPIAAEHGEDIDDFYRCHFNPYLNVHRPFGQPERITDEAGKTKYVYRRYATPWEVLRELTLALPEGESYLKPEYSIEKLDRIGQNQSGRIP